MRSLLYFIGLFAVLLLVTVFAALNPGVISLDLAFFEVDVQKSLALSVAFGLGWLFGLLCVGVVMLRAGGERRRLRRSLRLAEAEVRALRSLPMQDAD